MYPTYRDIENWVIIDEATIHDFGELENEIHVVNVLIGMLHKEHINFNNKIEYIRTPITRWMTIKTFHSYQENN